MSRVIAVVACGFTLAACSMSMPSLDFFRSSPPTEVLRIESEPPGADARTAEGQSCRTPCELTVPATGEVAISFALQGYQPQTVSVRSEAAPAASYAEAAPPAGMQPNPVYAELTPAAPSRQQKKQKGPAKAKKVVAKKSVAPTGDPPPMGPPPSADPAGGGSTRPTIPGRRPRPRNSGLGARSRVCAGSPAAMDALADIRQNSLDRCEAGLELLPPARRKSSRAGIRRPPARYQRAGWHDARRHINQATSSAIRDGR